MIYCVICDISAVSDTAGVEAQVAAYGISRTFLDVGSANFRRRAAAYSALGIAYERLSAALGRRQKLPKIFRDLLGKPCFVNEDDTVFKSFSISYTGELVAIAFSDTPHPLGVDIEAERELRNPEKIEARICSGVNRDLRFMERYCVSYFLMSLSADGRPLSFAKIPDASLDYLGRGRNFVSAAEKRGGEKEAPLLQKWTVTEALLKADGGGFCSIQDINTIKSHALCESVSLVLLGKKLYISVAVKSGKLKIES